MPEEIEEEHLLYITKVDVYIAYGAILNGLQGFPGTDMLNDDEGGGFTFSGYD